MMKKVLLIAALLLVPSFAFAQSGCLLTYQTESLGAFFVGQPANFNLEAVSGTEPYQFEIVDGALPEGMHLTPSGRIRGVPTTETDNTTVFIRVTDAAGCHLTQAFAVYVFPADQAP